VYTWILCDLHMPELDGRGFYQALQWCQPALCARVVFLTGDTLTPAVQAFLAQTGVPVLTKPFTAACLRGCLTAC
jgi:CheY-like chemotaxis protein